MNEQAQRAGILGAIGSAHDQVRGQGFAMLERRDAERRRNPLSFSKDLLRQIEYFAEHPPHPCLVKTRIGPRALLILLPLLEGEPERPSAVGIDGVEALRKRAQQYRQ